LNAVRRFLRVAGAEIEERLLALQVEVGRSSLMSGWSSSAARPDSFDLW